MDQAIKALLLKTVILRLVSDLSKYALNMSLQRAYLALHLFFMLFFGTTPSPSQALSPATINRSNVQLGI